jgi:hypothetical protein
MSCYRNTVGSLSFAVILPVILLGIADSSSWVLTHGKQIPSSLQMIRNHKDESHHNLWHLPVLRTFIRIKILLKWRSLKQGCDGFICPHGISQHCKEIFLPHYKPLNFSKTWQSSFQNTIIIVKYPVSQPLQCMCTSTIGIKGTLDIHLCILYQFSYLWNQFL